MLDVLREALAQAMQDVERDSEHLPVNACTESVFRHYFCRSLARACPGIKLFVECDKIDLVVQSSSELAFVEFKFYVHREAVDPCTGLTRGQKSFPSLKNYREFEQCVTLLRQRAGPDHRAVVLFFADPSEAKHLTYATKYAAPDFPASLGIRVVARVNPFECLRSGATCNAALFDVPAMFDASDVSA